MKFSPLPVRNGLNAVRVVLPQHADAPTQTDGTAAPHRSPRPAAARWPTVASYLYERFPDQAEQTRAKIEAREVVLISGDPITTTTPYQVGLAVWFYRDPLPEPVVPFECKVLHRDENLLVVDKPHFLATLPRGAFVTQSAVVRLRQQFDLPDLTPVHRLDRVTAGVLVFTVRPQVRGAYQLLFQRRQVAKQYAAIAAIDAALELPRVHRTRIEKKRGELRAREVEGPANTETLIHLDARVAGSDAAGRPLGRYHLEPHTGKTHQLRLHLAGLGIPIVNDDLYPEVTRDSLTDYTRPLQLLARRLEFVDPLSGRPTVFESGLRLDGDVPA
ncbi:pseudouridine synthase [Micrococcales bacterium 31B]|nr:pseudouridine synthase [Micrococcales bacterium 31B]